MKISNAGSLQASRLIACASLFFVSLAAAGSAAAQSMPRHVVAGGGGRLSGAGAYFVGGTIGQADAGLLGAGVYTVKGGFWHGGATVVGVEPPRSPAADVPL